MKRIASIHSQIYNYFHSSNSCQQHFFAPAQEDEYVAYYNSMYLLRDTTDSLDDHRSRGFSSNPLVAYLEFWGVMQAINIQQDAICELHKVVSGASLHTGNFNAWKQLRELRHLCAGHPAHKSHGGPLTRTFMGRKFGDYRSFKYEIWEKGLGIKHPNVALGNLLDSYILEAETALQGVLSDMRVKWP